MLANSPARSSTSRSSDGSVFSRVNAAVSSCASALGIRQVSAPRRRTVERHTRAEQRALGRRHVSRGTGSTMAKKLSSATMARARSSASRSVGNAAGKFIEDISHHLRPDRLVDVPARQTFHLLPARLRSIGGHDDACRRAAAPDARARAAAPGPDITGMLMSVKSASTSLASRTASASLPLAASSTLADRNLAQLHRATHELPHHRRVVHDQNVERFHRVSLQLLHDFTSARHLHPAVRRPAG